MDRRYFDGRGVLGEPTEHGHTHKASSLRAWSWAQPKFCWRAAGNPAHAEPPAPDVCLQRAGSCVSHAPSTSCLLPELAFPPNICLRAWGNAWSLPPPQKHACSLPLPSHGGFSGFGAGCSLPSVTARSTGRQGSLALGEFPQIFGCWGVGSRAAQSQGCEQLLALCKSRRRAGGSQKLWDLLLGEPRELRGHALLSKATERVHLGAKIPAWKPGRCRPRCLGARFGLCPCWDCSASDPSRQSSEGQGAGGGARL